MPYCCCLRGTVGIYCFFSLLLFFSSIFFIYIIHYHIILTFHFYLNSLQSYIHISLILFFTMTQNTCFLGSSCEEQTSFHFLAASSQFNCECCSVLFLANIKYQDSSKMNMLARIVQTQPQAVSMRGQKDEELKYLHYLENTAVLLITSFFINIGILFEAKSSLKHNSCYSLQYLVWTV